MRSHTWLASLALAVSLLACNRNSPPPSAPTTALLNQTAVLPSATVTPPSLPLALPTYTRTSTPNAAFLRSKDALVNCRLGPGTVYTLIGELKEGQSASIAGANSQRTWFYIKDPGNPDGYCWVSADVVEVTGNTDQLAIILPPAPSVTEINLTVEPAKLVVACDQFPQVVYFYADITTDAPVLVTYRWEVSTGVTSVDNAIAFEGAGTQTVSEYYQIAGPNDYWIVMHVLGPNDISERANFRVTCNP